LWVTGGKGRGEKEELTRASVVSKKKKISSSFSDGLQKTGMLFGGQGEKENCFTVVG